LWHVPGITETCFILHLFHVLKLAV
uniref:Predicted gene, 17364 n=1 Tax=Mus spicilegus TaxID=10103 RepID=A0A8C6GDJ5_MUSSI